MSGQGPAGEGTQSVGLTPLLSCHPCGKGLWCLATIRMSPIGKLRLKEAGGALTWLSLSLSTVLKALLWPGSGF